MTADYGLRERVFDLLNEAPIEDSDLLVVSPDGLAAFLVEYGGKYRDGEPDLLHGVPAAELIPHCAEWLAEWLAEWRREHPTLRVIAGGAP